MAPPIISSHRWPLMVIGNDYMTGQTILLNGGMAFI